MMPAEPNDPLSHALSQWQVSAPADPHFRPAVWRRIRARAGESWSRYLQAHFASWAAAAIVGLSAAGWAGHALSAARLDAARDAMVTSYLIELDPRVQAVLRPAAP